VIWILPEGAIKSSRAGCFYVALGAGFLRDLLCTVMHGCAICNGRTSINVDNYLPAKYRIRNQ
jgi:hypothetical protein